MDFLLDLLWCVAEYFCWRSKARKEPEPRSDDDPRIALRSRYNYPP
jgi:hypothetical protein